jgi:hypothetical protein
LRTPEAKQLQIKNNNGRRNSFSDKLADTCFCVLKVYQNLNEGSQQTPKNSLKVVL